tara:strand:+ start:1022 stop:1150 length:129 start_codon:yes stop_codon:yes gene_type:complete
MKKRSIIWKGQKLFNSANGWMTEKGEKIHPKTNEMLRRIYKS